MITLNPQQQAIVDDPADHLIVNACPGSGKTRVFVARIQRMVAQGINPASIIAITFTNSGATEFRHRLEPIVPGVCSTLHSFVLRLMIKHGPEYLYNVSGVLDDQEKEALVAECMTYVRYKGAKKDIGPALKDPRCIWKKPGMTPDPAQQVAIEYHNRLRYEGLLDYDTLLMIGAKFAEEVLSKRPSWWTYDHLLVDEAQDNADEDWAIYSQMPVRTRFVVGDPEQSIFRFRGASVGQFRCRLSDPLWKSMPLERNYRSTETICNAATSVISHNSGRVARAILSDRSGPALDINYLRDPGHELTFLFDEIYRLPAPETSQSPDVAVLTRNNGLASDIASYLTAKGVQVVQPKPPPLPRDWSRAMTILAFLINPANDKAALRYVRATEGVEAAAEVQKRATRAMASVSSQLGKIRHVEQLTLTEIVQNYRFSVETEAVLNKLASEAGDDLTSIYAAAQDLAREQQAEGIGRVYVGTAHSSKGREFERVYIAGCEEGWFPSLKADSDLEEERRLFFVAMTRAKTKLSLTLCAERPENRGKNLKPGPMKARQPSRFIAEL